MLQYRYLSDEDDGVSEAIIPFAVQYVGILKVHTTLVEVCSRINNTYSRINNTYSIVHIQ